MSKKTTDKKLREVKAKISYMSKEDLIKAKTFLSGIIDFRKMSKLYDTYIQGIKESLDNTGSDKVYIEYELDGTLTGRGSCKGYTASQTKLGVSLHTLPKPDEDDEDGGLASNIRSLFVAPEDYVFIAADYKAMELRMTAHIAKEKSMAKAFEDKVDIHQANAAKIFEKVIEEVAKQERNEGKTTSFLVMYGGGAMNLAQTMQIPIKRAEEIIESFFKAFPGIKREIDKTQQDAMENLHLRSIFGRYRHLPNIRSSNMGVALRAGRQGFNFRIQSAASDVLLMEATTLARRFRLQKRRARLLGIVHDSVEIICHKDEVHEVLMEIYYFLVNYPTVKKYLGYELFVPLEIDVEVGPSFGEGKHVIYDNRGVPLNTKELVEYACK